MRETCPQGLFKRGDFIVHEFSKIATFKGFIEELKEEGAMIRICVNRKKKEVNDMETVFAPYKELKPFNPTSKAV